MNHWFKAIITIGFAVLLLSPVQAFAAGKNPVAVLSQVKGDVTYSKNGKKWKKVRRNKFLKEGYSIKSGANGKGTLTVQGTGDSFTLTGNTTFHIKKGKIVTDAGKLEAAASSALVAGLMRRFDQSQTYTTVRRSASSKKLHLESARQLSLSKDHPFIAFENPGAEYKFRINVGKKSYNVPASKNAVVRAKIGKFDGVQPYSIEVYKGKKKVYSMKPYRQGKEKKSRELKWLSAAEAKNVQSQIKGTHAAFPGNDAMLSKVYEQAGLFVPAMDAYQAYLTESPDDEDIYPYYFWVIKKQLFLTQLYTHEMVKYKSLTE